MLRGMFSAYFVGCSIFHATYVVLQWQNHLEGVQRAHASRLRMVGENELAQFFRKIAVISSYCLN